MSPDLTIIIATRHRPKLLDRVLDDVGRQRHERRPATLVGDDVVVNDPDPLVEVIVVADGRDAYEDVRRVVDYHVQRWPLVARTSFLDRHESHVGQFGAPCKDAGTAMARGAYVAYWDDDNVYRSSAVESLLASVRDGTDVGVCRVEIGRSGVIVPRQWTGEHCGRLAYGDVDSACLVVRREIAARYRWHDGRGRGTDHRWLTRLLDGERDAGRPVKMSYRPDVVARHL